ncbi:MAG: type II toxin-antitoxin system VapC family toxin [Fibromonadales bacterium]|nr:type II toxin-antitoxin system VapC family toxin [Fibromonadales bacterium]
MKYLLDTNVISELRKKACNLAVKNTIEKIEPSDLYLSVISIGEIEMGVRKLAEPQKKLEISLWLHNKLPLWFSDRIIPINFDIMVTWGKLCAENKRTLPVIDSLIAATAITYKATLLTRNTKDFEDIRELDLINPWNLNLP